MDTIGTVSQSELVRRRRQLRRSRRQKVFQACWQLLAVSSLAGFLLWTTTSPALVIDTPEQVEIDGNEFLSDQAIRSLLPLSYPQSMLQVRPQELARELESQGPIAKASVSRELFPPGLKVTVQERYPVAIASEGNAIAPGVPTDTPPGLNSNPAVGSPGMPSVGLLDERGMWMPLESYTDLDPTVQLPQLRAIGPLEQYRSSWETVYQSIRRSPIKIYEINWQDPANLILKTELGVVHCGPYSPRFGEQVTRLGQMGDLPNQIDLAQIAYIDLTNPDRPSLQRIGVTAPQTVPTP
ncbi:FtsQ-type POTRA domain-containing protein [Phormidium pseudopriestleyi FRX01]|uniref:FtsQ-type POTRA domain-containing protein n=1 Tax=Phormidium pseudopriestleyi FRX01 TaxID=1759528 RepID=A0ABS3FXX8_9CYAN|nr:FtsQ-type POTRA domain-containing protein [Phormidium pseudopriestleyi]MBO0351192.1 FtsQ-type POTRA domain-containing protein [Phormidium pseudopriestleyi FRX01]